MGHIESGVGIECVLLWLLCAGIAAVENLHVWDDVVVSDWQEPGVSVSRRCWLMVDIDSKSNSAA